MKVIEEMIRAGVDKALELGILPRHNLEEDIATNCELMQEVLQAALGALLNNDRLPLQLNGTQAIQVERVANA